MSKIGFLPGLLVDAATLPQASEAAITLAVNGATGDDTPSSDRPAKIVKGDYSAYPFATIQAAINAVPLLTPYPVTINVAEGNYAGYYIRARSMGDWFQVVGTRGIATLATGSTAGTVTSGSVTQLTVTGAGWTPGDLIGKFVEITAGAGAGQIFVIADNTADTIYFAARMSPAPNATSSFQILEPKTVINSGNSWVSVAGAWIANSQGYFQMKDVKVTGLTYNVFAFNVGGEVAFQRVVASGGYYGIAAQDVLQCRWSQLAALNCPGAGIAHLAVVTAGNRDKGWAIYNCNWGYLAEGVNAIIQYGVYCKGCATYGLHLTNGPAYSMQDVTLDGCGTAVRAQIGFVELQRAVIKNSTVGCFDLFDTRLLLETSLTGSGNAGWGLYAYGFNNRVALNFMTPSISGAAGEVTVDGSTDVTWANLAAANDSARHDPSGTLVLRRD